jgi:hypothetical protein
MPDDLPRVVYNPPRPPGSTSRPPAPPPAPPGVERRTAHVSYSTRMPTDPAAHEYLMKVLAESIRSYAPPAPPAPRRPWWRRWLRRKKAAT